MSVTRIKIIAAVSVKELEHQANIFLSQDNVEVKELHYQTNGYEQPYSVAILYHEKDRAAGKRDTWKNKIISSK